MKFIYALILVVLTSCASNQNSESQKKAEIYFSHGTQNLLNKEYTQALVHLLKAADLDPKNSEIRNNLGMAYYLKGDKSKAKKEFSYSLELDDKNCDTRGNLASIMLEEGNLVEAEKNYLTMLEDLTYDKHARTYYNLGIIQVKKRNVGMAESYFAKSITEDSNYCPAYMQLGFLTFQKRKFQDALKHFKEASMGTCVKDPLPYYHQALTYIELKNFGMARLKFSEIEAMNITPELAQLVNAKQSELNAIESEYKAENLSAKKSLK